MANTHINMRWGGHRIKSVDFPKHNGVKTRLDLKGWSRSLQMMDGRSLMEDETPHAKACIGKKTWNIWVSERVKRSRRGKRWKMGWRGRGHKKWWELRLREEGRVGWQTASYIYHSIFFFIFTQKQLRFQNGFVLNEGIIQGFFF